MRVVGEHEFDLLHSDAKVRARVYEPVPEAGGSWTSYVVIDAPFSCSWEAGGATSLEALIAELRILSILVYSAKGYERGKLGWKGTFGGDLGLPATHLFLDVAPYPF